MAQTIQIKRSTGTGKPTTVAQGELFYAYGSNGTYGKRLAIGHVNGGGNTPEIIGGSLTLWICLTILQETLLLQVL